MRGRLVASLLAMLCISAAPPTERKAVLDALRPKDEARLGPNV